MLHGHGDDTYKYNIELKANFSSNILPYGTDSKLIDYIQQNLSNISNYPEPLAMPLSIAIAKNHSISPNNVLATNGATEAFYLIAELFSGKKSTILIPSFAEYEDACTKFSHQITFVKNNCQLHEIVENTDLIWLCNPNNPDGKLFKSDLIIDLATQHTETYFIIDEAYIDFTLKANSVLHAIANLKNIIVIRSLTKKYVVPGLRLGYIVAHENIIGSIEKLLMPWRIGALTISAGIFLLEQLDGNFNNLRNQLLKDSLILQKQINELEDFNVIPSSTNYFLVECSCSASQIKQYLLENHGILIRDASNFRSLTKNMIRISTQTTQKNKFLVKALSEWKTTLK